MNPQGYDTQPMTLASGNIPPLVRLLQAYIEKGSKVIVQAKKEVTKRQQHVIKIKYPYSPLECQQFVMLSVNFQVLAKTSYTWCKNESLMVLNLTWGFWRFYYNSNNGLFTALLLSSYSVNLKSIHYIMIVCIDIIIQKITPICKTWLIYKIQWSHNKEIFGEAWKICM